MYVVVVENETFATTFPTTFPTFPKMLGEEEPAWEGEAEAAGDDACEAWVLAAAAELPDAEADE